MITSSSNSLVKLVSGLHHKKGRLEQNLYLAEGIHLVQEALSARIPISYFFWSAKLTGSPQGTALLHQLSGNCEGYEVSESVFAKLAETENPQGILAVLSIPSDPEFNLGELKLGLIIDGLQDPGNVGTIIRTAWAGGLDCLIFGPDSADPYQGKVVRASQGGVFHLKIFRKATPEVVLQEAHRANIQILAGDPKASQNYFDCNLLSPTLILIGNEGRGVSPIWENFLVKKVNIPQPGQAESLNAAVSAGILVYEAIRQRLLKDTCKS